MSNEEKETTITITLEYECDTREAALKLMAELKQINRSIDGVFLKHALLDEDWFLHQRLLIQWLQSVEKAEK